MTENLYGDVDASDEPDASAPKRKRKSTPKKKIDGNILRVQAMGSTIEIVSPIPRDKFVEEMVDTINEKGADPMWSGWYHLKKTDGKIVSVRLRSIDVVEEM
jgi:hypothetical protein